MKWYFTANFSLFPSHLFTLLALNFSFVTHHCSLLALNSSLTTPHPQLTDYCYIIFWHIYIGTYPCLIETASWGNEMPILTIFWGVKWIFRNYNANPKQLQVQACHEARCSSIIHNYKSHVHSHEFHSHTKIDSRGSKHTPLHEIIIILFLFLLFLALFSIPLCLHSFAPSDEAEATHCFSACYKILLILRSII